MSKKLIKKCQDGEVLRLQYESIKKELEQLGNIEINYNDPNYNELINQKIDKSDSLRKQLKQIGYQLGEYTLNKYKDTRQDPLLLTNWTGRGQEEDTELLKKWHIRETPEVREYFKSYVNSEGFDRILNNQNEWWENRHPYRKFYQSSETNKTKRYTQKHFPPVVFSLDMYAEQSWYKPGQHTAFVGDRMSEAWNDDGYDFTHDQALGHEISHGMGVTYTNGQKEALDQNQNTKINQHDEYRSEKHADLWGLRYMLYKEGIYDSRSNQDITVEEIQKLRDKYPNLRSFKQMTNEELMFQLNHVAQNNNIQDSDIYYAKQGKKLISKHNQGNKVAEIFGIDTSKFTKNPNSTKQDSKKITNHNEQRNKLTKKKHASYINPQFVNARPTSGFITFPRKKIIESEYKNS